MSLEPLEALPRVCVPRWPTERALLLLNALVAAGLWFLFLRSLQSAAYIGVSLLIFGLMHLTFIAAIRGSAVRLGPGQFPELYAHVTEIAWRLGLRRVPDIYLMQQDGALNAFAVRFVRTHMVVLLSDLLEACGDNADARDMIIGHELGHIRAGHLRARWLLMPASFVPFLGSALSRAREYTCDRYGLAASGDRDRALRGLAILAAGGTYGPHVDLGSLIGQRHELRSVWMVVGEWLGSHPPLSKRIWALAPELEGSHIPVRGALMVMRVAFAASVVVVVGSAALLAYLPRLGVKQSDTGSVRPQPAGNLEQQVSRDLERLKAFLEIERAAGRDVPWDVWDLYARWQSAHPDDDGPIDPSNGYWYTYRRHGDSYRLSSAGPNGESDTADDVVLDSGADASPHRRYVYPKTKSGT
jgi:Zn-dependent protease with chaperone function